MIWIEEFCNMIWAQKNNATDWHLARICAIFKKGKSELCSNYRHISLLNIAYKIFAHILLKRLKSAGAENRIHSTQYGFRSNFGTNDALFVVRRFIDQTLAIKNGKLILLALDWSKAFDSISSEALLNTLYRFGIPESFNDMIRAIYSNRRFFVREAGQDSSIRSQHFRICQGCPLSHFFLASL